jgi:hypothetical protein
MDEFFGTTAWRKHLNRRNLVESGNSWKKYHLGLRRDSIRVHRDPRTRLHRGLWTVGILIEMCRRWRLADAASDPQQHLDDDAAQPSGDLPGDPENSNSPDERSGAPPDQIRSPAQNNRHIETSEHPANAGVQSCQNSRQITADSNKSAQHSEQSRKGAPKAAMPFFGPRKVPRTAMCSPAQVSEGAHVNTMGMIL